MWKSHSARRITLVTCCRNSHKLAFAQNPLQSSLGLCESINRPVSPENCQSTAPQSHENNANGWWYGNHGILEVLLSQQETQRSALHTYRGCRWSLRLKNCCQIRSRQHFEKSGVKRLSIANSACQLPKNLESALPVTMFQSSWTACLLVFILILITSKGLINEDKDCLLGESVYYLLTLTFYWVNKFLGQPSRSFKKVCGYKILCWTGRQILGHQIWHSWRYIRYLSMSAGYAGKWAAVSAVFFLFQQSFWLPIRYSDIDDIVLIVSQ